MVERRLTYYRWYSSNAERPFLPYEAAATLRANIERDPAASVVRRRDSITAVQVLAGGDAATPSRFQVLSVRHEDDRPVEWSPGQNVRTLIMDDGYSTADVTYFTLWPDGYAAQDFHSYAPRPSRLAQLLKLRVGAHVSFNVLYRRDMMEKLRRLRGQLRTVELAITSPELADAQHVGMMATLFPAAFGAQVPSLSIRLGMGRYGPRDRYLDAQTEEAVFQVAENAQELVDSLSITGIDPSTERSATVNLLQERVGHTVDVEPNVDATSLPDEKAIFEAMDDARQELDALGLLQTASEAQPVRPS